MIRAVITIAILSTVSVAAAIVFADYLGVLGTICIKTGTGGC